MDEIGRLRSAFNRLAEVLRRGEQGEEPLREELREIAVANGFHPYEFASTLAKLFSLQAYDEGFPYPYVLEMSVASYAVKNRENAIEHLSKGIGEIDQLESRIRKLN